MKSFEKVTMDAAEYGVSVFERKHNYGPEFKVQKFKRFYYESLGYFPFGDVVRTTEVFDGVTTGVVVGCKENTDDARGAVYVIRVALPDNHPDAKDENGELQLVKTFLIWQSELNHLNPER